jgi:hypothetical protein
MSLPEIKVLDIDAEMAEKLLELETSSTGRNRNKVINYLQSMVK